MVELSAKICFGCSKGPLCRDNSFEYPQHMLCLRNKINVELLHRILGHCKCLIEYCSKHILHHCINARYNVPQISQKLGTGHRAQSVTCLSAYPGIVSSIRVRSHTFVEIDHEIISMTILLPSADSRRVVVSYKWKYVHKVLVNRLVKLAQEKSVVR